MNRCHCGGQVFDQKMTRCYCEGWKAKAKRWQGFSNTLRPITNNINNKFSTNVNIWVVFYFVLKIALFSTIYFEAPLLFSANHSSFDIGLFNGQYLLPQNCVCPACMSSKAIESGFSLSLDSNDAASVESSGSVIKLQAISSSESCSFSILALRHLYLVFSLLLSIEFFFSYWVLLYSI